jgi:hypothetical protein
MDGGCCVGKHTKSGGVDGVVLERKNVEMQNREGTEQDEAGVEEQRAHQSLTNSR